MKIKKNKTLLSIFFGLLLLLVASLIAYRLFFFTEEYRADAPTQAEVELRQKTEAEAKKSFIENETLDDAQPAPVPDSTDAVEVRAEKTGSNEVTVFSRLKGYASGTCTLSIANDSKSYERTADVIYQPQYSTCAGFSVPISSLGVGTWSIKLSITAPDGSMLTKSTTIAIR